MRLDPSLQRILLEAESGGLDAAIASAQAVLRVKPRDAEAMQVLGLLLSRAGHLDRAAECLGKAVAISPTTARYRVNLGNALLSGGKHAEAAAQYRKVLELDRTNARAWIGLATAYKLQLRSADAIETCLQALEMTPDWPDMERVTAAVLESGYMVDDAVALLESVCARHPGRADIRSLLLMTLGYTSIAPEELAARHRQYQRCVGGPATPAAPVDRHPDRPLRIGILSGDLRTHSVAYFADAFFRSRPDQDTLTVFATNPPVPQDPVAAEFRRLADGWVEAAALDDGALDRAVRDRRIDVLVELSGHSALGRLAALDRGPAPVIVSAIGYPDTTGHPMVGWRAVDSMTDPPGAERLSTERLLRLDPCFLCYAPPRDAPAPAMPEADAPPTFGSFNLTSKMGAETARLWSSVLAAVPESRLLIKSQWIADAATRERVLDAFERAGIARSRVETIAFAPSPEEHLRTYRRVHVALDTVPYNGTTTTCEALWMGVPVVALLGERHAARVGASLLSAAGLPDLLARTSDEFVALSAALMNDRARLSQLRHGLRARLQGSPLLDAASYAERFHAGLRSCWRAWCAEHRA